jgi:hypothetical protein
MSDKQLELLNILKNSMIYSPYNFIDDIANMKQCDASLVNKIESKFYLLKTRNKSHRDVSYKWRNNKVYHIKSQLVNDRTALNIITIQKLKDSFVNYLSTNWNKYNNGEKELSYNADYSINFDILVKSKIEYMDILPLLGTDLKVSLILTNQDNINKLSASSNVIMHKCGKSYGDDSLYVISPISLKAEIIREITSYWNMYNK